MIPSYIPKVGTIVRFGDEKSKRYIVKNVVETTVRTDDGYYGTGEGWVCIKDKRNYEYLLPFSRFKHE